MALDVSVLVLDLTHFALKVVFLTVILRKILSLDVFGVGFAKMIDALKNLCFGCIFFV